MFTQTKYYNFAPYFLSNALKQKQFLILNYFEPTGIGSGSRKSFKYQNEHDYKKNLLFEES